MNGPPQVDPPNHEIYQLMGEENIFQMLEDFYDELAVSKIKDMFPSDPDELAEAAYKSGCFFVGLCGGPALYHEKYGNPMLRRRHFPFPIDMNGRNIWLECFLKTMEKAEEKYAFPKQHLPGFINFLTEFSPWMVNKA